MRSLFFILLMCSALAANAEQCLKPQEETNPFLLKYNCSFLGSSSFRALVGFGGEWQQHLSIIKSFLNQDCLGIDRLVNRRVQQEINDQLNQQSSDNVRANISIGNSGSSAATDRVLEAIYGR